MKLLAVSDLCARWKYSKAGIHKLRKNEYFPQPAAMVCKGRIAVFLEEEIVKYEITRPWLFDEGQKIQRQKLYAKLQLAKRSDHPEYVLKKLFGNKAVPWKI